MHRLLLILALSVTIGATAMPGWAADRGDRGGPPRHERPHGDHGRHHGNRPGHHRGHRPHYRHHYWHRGHHRPHGYGHRWHHYPRHHFYRHGHRGHGHHISVWRHHYTDPGAVILGSAVGGMIGHSLGDGDPYATLSGVIVGGAIGYGLGHHDHKTYRIDHHRHRRW
jgi:hypothetical protein